MNEVKASPGRSTSSLPWKKEDCTQERIQDKVLEKFQLIVIEAEERKSNCKSNTKLLYSGFWYANDYYKAVSKYRSLVGPLKENGSFYHGRSPSAFLPIADELQPGGKRISAYTLGKKVTPSEALKSIRTSVCFIDCQEAIQFAYYETLLEVWGEKVFNRHFGSKSRMPLCLDTDTTRTPLASLLLSDQTFETTDESFYSSIQKADELYFKNIPFFAAKHFNGEAIGYHCMCSQSDDVKKFLVFGGSAEGLDEEQMLELCASECNATPVENSDVYSGLFLDKMEEMKRLHELRLSQETKNADQSRTITVEEIRRVQQQNPQAAGLKPWIRRLDIEKIRKELK